MPDRALAQVRRATLARLERDRAPHARLRRVPGVPEGIRDRRAPGQARPQRLHRGLERVDHGLVADGCCAEVLDRSESRREDLDQLHALEGRLVAEHAAAAAQRRAPQSPLAPPTVPTSVRPARMRSLPGGELESASRAWTTASKPLVMLVPWSPSPIAASSWTRWSFSSRMTTSIPCIQVAIVAASMTLALIKLIATRPSAVRGCGPARPTACSALRRARAR